MPRIDDLLHTMLARRASDLHLTAGHPPYLRIDGDIAPLPEQPPLASAAIRELVYEIMPEHNRRQLEEEWDTDFAHEIGSEARFRVNAFFDRHGMGAVLRLIPSRVPTADELGLPKVLREFCMLNKGLVVVTGPTGSGKSTTMAAMVDYVNRHRADHIITIEDPIEFVHRPIRCLINQREVHRHTRSFANALRAALREDPDIVLVGELRDLETMEIAIETAETGHLVFGTLHTTTAPSTVDRIIDKFPSDRQNQIRTMLADSLRGVVAQTLCKRKAGGRVAAMEILVATPAVAANIRDGKTHQIPSLMQTSRGAGMQTLNDALVNLVTDGVITAKEAYQRAVEKAALAKKFAELGLPFSVDMQLPIDQAAIDAAPEPSRAARTEALLAENEAALQADPRNIQALNNLAWIYATSLDDHLRNGAQALKCAERAVELSGGRNAQVLDTLAAAYAETRRFEKAVAAARRAQELAIQAGDQELAQRIAAQLELYREQRPLRDA